MTEIIPFLFLGNVENSMDKEFLKRNKITNILCVASNLKCQYPDEFNYLKIPAYDDEQFNLGLYFDQMADFIHNSI